MAENNEPKNESGNKIPEEEIIIVNDNQGEDLQESSPSYDEITEQPVKRDSSFDNYQKGYDLYNNVHNRFQNRKKDANLPDQPNQGTGSDNIPKGLKNRRNKISNKSTNAENISDGPGSTALDKLKPGAKGAKDAETAAKSGDALGKGAETAKNLIPGAKDTGNFAKGAAKAGKAADTAGKAGTAAKAGQAAGQAAKAAATTAAKTGAKAAASATSKVGIAALATNPVFWIVIGVIILIIIILVIVIFVVLNYELESQKNGSVLATKYVNCDMITVETVDESGNLIDTEVFEFEDYIAGVVTSEIGSAGKEAMKAQAVAARSYAIHITNFCNNSIRNSESQQTYKTPSSAAITAANETKGQIYVDSSGENIATYYSSYPPPSGGLKNYTVYPACKPVDCEKDADRFVCTTTTYKVPSGDELTFTMPKTKKSGGSWNGIDLGQQVGDCVGMSQVYAMYLDEVGYTYEEILAKFYDGEIGEMLTVEESDGSIAWEGVEYYDCQYTSSFRQVVGSHIAWDLSASPNAGIYASEKGSIAQICTSKNNFTFNLSSPQCTVYGFSDNSIGQGSLGCDDSYGNAVIVQHNNNLYTLYAHMSGLNPSLTLGMELKADTLLGYIGTTGCSSGNHLHFETRLNGGEFKHRVDPASIYGAYDVAGRNLFCKRKGTVESDTSNNKQNSLDYAAPSYDNSKKQHSNLAHKHLVLVNKLNYLNKDDEYQIGNLESIAPIYMKNGNSTDYLNSEAYKAYKEMYADATKVVMHYDDRDKPVYMKLYIQSPYRNYGYQANLFDGYVRDRTINGMSLEAAEKEVETFSTRPGHSEHQTGLTFDVVGSTGSKLEASDKGSQFAWTWLRNNSYKYGFIIRFTEKNQSITGIIPEPWHLRYIGKEDSMKYHKDGYTSFEEYYYKNVNK